MGERRQKTRCTVLLSCVNFVESTSYRQKGGGGMGWAKRVRERGRRLVAGMHVGGGGWRFWECRIACQVGGSGGSTEN